MSEFSSCLNDIKEERGITSALIAQVMEVDVSVIYRWVKGERLPNSYDKVKMLAEKLKLSHSERIRLKEAYEISSIGEVKYKSFKKIEEFINVLQKRKAEYEIYSSSQAFMGIHQYRELPDEVILNNNLEILQCIQNVLDYMQIQKNKHIYIKLQKNMSEISMMIKMFLSKVQGAYIEQIVSVPDDINDLSLFYLDMLKNATDIIAQKNDVRVYYGDKKRHMMGTTGNCIFSEDFLIQFDDEMSYGMITTDKTAIEFEKNNYNIFKESCFVLYNKSENPMEYVERNIDRVCAKVYGIEYMPCMGLVIPEDVLQECLYEFPEKQQFIQIMKNSFDLVMSSANEQDKIMQAKTYFDKKGLIKFMESGRFEVFPYDIYHTVSVEARCKVLKNAIRVMKSGIVEQNMFKEDYGINVEGIHIEYEENEKKLYIETHFDKKTSEVLEIEEEHLCGNFKDYFEYLNKCDKVYSVEETVEYMEEILAQYEQSI